MLAFVYAVSVIAMAWLVISKGEWSTCLNESISEYNDIRIKKGYPPAGRVAKMFIELLAMICTAAIIFMPVLNTCLLVFRAVYTSKK